MESPVHGGTIRLAGNARNGTEGCGTPSTASQGSFPGTTADLEKDSDTAAAYHPHGRHSAWHCVKHGE
jgi:hypothetical protein